MFRSVPLLVLLTFAASTAVAAEPAETLNTYCVACHSDRARSGGLSLERTTKDGNTALMFAAGVGYRDKNTTGSESDALEALKVSIEAGLDLHQANDKGETALHGAASRGAGAIVQFLAGLGADLNAKTKQGHTPLDVAMGKATTNQLPVPKDSTVALLRKLGAREGQDVKD